MQNMQAMQLQLGNGIAAAAAAARGGPGNGGMSGWPSHLMQLPSDLGLGDSCGDVPANLLQQQQLLMQASVGSDVMVPMLQGSILGVNASGSFCGSDIMGRGAAECSSSDVAGMLGSAVPPPPPPPAHQQQGVMGAPPPPPPRGNTDGYNSYGNTDGRLSGDETSGVIWNPERAGASSVLHVMSSCTAGHRCCSFSDVCFPHQNSNAGCTSNPLIALFLQVLPALCLLPHPGH
jgi:hypothetical protein